MNDAPRPPAADVGTVARDIKQQRPFPSLAAEAMVALLRTSDELRHRVGSVLAPAGLSPQQYNVLRILRGADAALPTLEIAERMIERSPGITRLLDRLEAKGLVSRVRCLEDRRQVLCTITAAGSELLASLDLPVQRADEQAVSGLDVDEQRQLVRALDRLRQTLAAGDLPG